MQAELIQLLEAHTPFDDAERVHVEHALRFVKSTGACCGRSIPIGHVTASAWVLAPDMAAALLTHHKKLGRWLQPGGHVEEGDRSIRAAALREACEESGIATLEPIRDALFDVDVHIIPARNGEPEHFHFDMRFAFRALDRAFVVGAESNRLAWVDLARIPDYANERSILRMVYKSAALGLPTS